MQSKKFTKAGVGFIAVFAILLMTTGLIMTACQSSVNPSTPGIATATKTFTPSPTITSTPPTPNAAWTPLPAGSIAFIGWARNGNGQFGFTSSVTLTAPTTIYFTDLSWDSTLTTPSNSAAAGAFSAQAVTVSAVAPKISEIEAIIGVAINTTILPNTAVYVGNPADVTNTAGVSVFNVAYWSDNVAQNGTLSTGVFNAAITFLKQSGQGNGDKLLAYTVPVNQTPTLSNGYLPSGSIFTTALIYGPDAFGAGAISHFYDSSLPTPLVAGTNAVDLHQLWNDSLNTNFPSPMQTAIAGGGNENAFIAGGPNYGTAGVLTNYCASYSQLYNNQFWVGSVVGAGSFGLANALTAANQGNTQPCGANSFGFYATPTVVMQP